MFALTSKNIEVSIFDLEKIILPVIEAQVTFGEKNQGCAGYGICSIAALAKETIKAEKKCCQTLVYLMPEENNHIRFIFPKEDMCKNIYRKYFNNEQFLVREDFLLTRSITQELGLASRLLQVGSYPIIEDDYLVEVIM